MAGVGEAKNPLHDGITRPAPEEESGACVRSRAHVGVVVSAKQERVLHREARERKLKELHAADRAATVQTQQEQRAPDRVLREHRQEAESAFRVEYAQHIDTCSRSSGSSSSAEREQRVTDRVLRKERAAESATDRTSCKQRATSGWSSSSGSGGAQAVRGKVSSSSGDLQVTSGGSSGSTDRAAHKQQTEKGQRQSGVYNAEVRFCIRLAVEGHPRGFQEVAHPDAERLRAVRRQHLGAMSDSGSDTSG
ncbi:hypothetical protein PybrP1_007378 [[Pythium] brassicae (nom. inval.)]|nr:hypothetical protein PybrP1_007378 [[Pythium] brassicae (nom. inval.)]